MTTEIGDSTEQARSTPCAGYANGGAERTLRDEIAIAMLPTVCAEANGTVETAAKELGIPTKEYDYRVHWPILAARRAYEYADAMLRERSGRHSHTVRMSDAPQQPSDSPSAREARSTPCAGSAPLP